MLRRRRARFFNGLTALAGNFLEAANTMLRNLTARRVALAKALQKPPSAFNLKKDLGIFTLIPPSGAGLVPVPIYYVFTPDEAAHEKSLDKLHGEPVAQSEIDGQVCLVFSNWKG